MYARDDVELLLPSVCWTHHLHPEQGEYGRTHECVRDESYWVNPPRKKRPPTTEESALDNIPEDMRRSFVLSLRGVSEQEFEALLASCLEGCDPADRKAFSNPKHANTVWAELIDMQTAWDKAPLTDKERIALYLRFGMRWTEEEIGFNQDVLQATISRRITNAIEKVVGRLNHGIWQTLELVEA